MEIFVSLLIVKQKLSLNIHKKLVIVILLSLFVYSNIYSDSVILLSLSEQTNGIRQIYLSKDHPKADGLNIRVEIPKSWMTREGIRPHIVQLFSSSLLENTIIGAALAIFPIPEEYSELNDDELAYNFFEINEGQDFIPANSDMIFKDLTLYDGQTGMLIIFSKIGVRSGIELLMMSVAHCFVYDKKIITLTTNWSVNPYLSPIELEKETEAFITLSVLLGNSIVILNKY